jgi:hypothetical protein
MMFLCRLSSNKGLHCRHVTVMNSGFDYQVCQYYILDMPFLKLYSSYNDLKNDRVERPLTPKEKVRQEKAVQSLNNLKKVARAVGS